MIDGVNQLMVNVSDFSVSVPWYEQVLQVPMNYQTEDKSWTEFKLPDGTYLAIVCVNDNWSEHAQKDAADHVGEHTGITLHTNDIAAEVERMRALGVDFPRDPVEKDWGIKAYFKDPDGNKFGLCQMKPGAEKG